MSYNITPGQTSGKLISSFFEDYEIKTLEISEAMSLAGDTVSEVKILFINDNDESSRDYSVKFKLLDESKDIHRYISKFLPEPNLSIEISKQADELSEQDLDALIRKFLQDITTRVKKIRKEESVQSITYVGNTFTLYKTTTFKVLSDDGEGRLEIEILSKDKGLQEASMTSHSLLDGLYLGSIELVKN